MGGKKKYDGYKAYSYLEPGLDYKEFKLRDPTPSEWSYEVPLSKGEEDRFNQLMEESIVIDLHEHPCSYPDDITESPLLFPHGRQYMAYEALSRSGLDCVFDNLMNGRSYIHTKHGWDWMATIHDLGNRLCDLHKQDFAIQCRSVDDIKRAHSEGKLAWVPVIESASCIENEVDRLDVLNGLGVMSMGVCYSESNMLGSGLNEKRDGGLTDFGYDAVKRMNKVGILVDVSHTGDQTALDTIEASGKPIVASHCGARGLMNTTRMFPDEVLQALAEKEGVVGVEVAGFGVRSDKNPMGGVDGYMEHIQYCIDLMGVDYVGCGPDSLYGDHNGHYNAFHSRNAINGWGMNPKPYKQPQKAYPKVQYVKGMENPTECLRNVTRWLVKNGYSDTEIKKIVGQNALKLLEKAW